MKRKECRAFSRAIDALYNQCVRDGYSNVRIYRRPDAIINMLIKMGILPEYALGERQGFFGLSHLVRVSLNVTLYYLYTHEDVIKDAIEDHTDKDPDEVFNVLLFSSIINSSNGEGSFITETLNRVTSRVQSLPRSFRHTVLTGDHLLQLAAA